MDVKWKMDGSKANYINDNGYGEGGKSMAKLDCSYFLEQFGICI